MPIINTKLSDGSAADIAQLTQLYNFYSSGLGYVFHILGRRAGFTSTSVLNDIKEFDNGVALNPVLSNTSLDIISSSASDAAAGTGVTSIKVTYINSANKIVQSSNITPNGTTLVTNVLAGVNEVLWMEATAIGSGLVAAGNIRLRINGGTVEVEQITAGGNKSLTARFMVPVGYTGFINSWTARSVNNDQDLRLRATCDSFTRALATPYHFEDNLYLAANQGQTQPLPWLVFPELCKIKVSTIAAATAATVRADVDFDIILIKN